jgi:hypothetical protein
MRFETEDGFVEIPIRARGFHPAPGDTFAIHYQPGNPQGYRREAGVDAVYGVIVAWAGVALFVVGAILLTLGWISRRRNRRPFFE